MLTAPTLMLAQNSATTTTNGAQGFGETIAEIGLNPFAGLFGADASRLDILNHPAELLDALQQLHIVWAGIFVAVGLLSVLNGYRWHRFIVLTIAFFVGLGLGNWMSRSMEASLVVAACVGVLLAVVAWPLMRYAIAVCGGLAGAFVGANAWTAMSMPPETHYAGALIGLVAFGMASFILYRVVIIGMTCIAGAFVCVVGVITLLMHVESLQSVIRDAFTGNTIIMPMLVLVTAVTGFVIQQSGFTLTGEGAGGGAKAGKPAPA
ncbi:MAG: hypothetical protein ACF8PN_07710 [Phycisphaerales bacterium]